MLCQRIEMQAVETYRLVSRLIRRGPIPSRVLFLGIVLAYGITVAQNRSGLPWNSGVSPGTGDGAMLVEKTTGFGDWRGRPVDVAALFIGQNSWQTSYAAYLTNEVLGAQGGVAAAKTVGILPVLTVPLVISADAGRFGYVAGGAIDAQHQAVADKIRSIMGDGVICLRLGHEADEGFPWSYTGHGGAGQPDPAVPADYKGAWKRIAQIYKTTMPNARMVWNVLKNTRQKIVDYYPGDDVVDIISVDVYDNGSGGYATSATSPGWLNYCLGSFNPSTGVSKGIGGALAFAKTHGKKVALDEWGATNDDLAAANGANNSFFVAGMYDFLLANSEYIEYESYFNRAGGGRHQIWPKTDYNPLPSDAYLSRYKPSTRLILACPSDAPQLDRRRGVETFSALGRLSIDANPWEGIVDAEMRHSPRAGGVYFCRTQTDGSVVTINQFHAQ